MPTSMTRCACATSSGVAEGGRREAGDLRQVRQDVRDRLGIGEGPFESRRLVAEPAQVRGVSLGPHRRLEVVVGHAADRGEGQQREGHDEQDDAHAERQGAHGSLTPAEPLVLSQY